MRHARTRRLALTDVLAHRLTISVWSLLVLAVVGGTVLIPEATAANNIRINEPRDGQVVYDTTEPLIVEAELGETNLVSTVRFKLLMDGEPVGRSSFPCSYCTASSPGHTCCSCRLLIRTAK